MDIDSSSSSLGKGQKILLLFLGFSLAAVLLLIRGDFNSQAPLNQLARNSMDPEKALLNGRPTLIEFYADWCEVCRKMAPSMLSLENQLGDKIDIVLLNVENDRWADLIELYEVNGIPQLNIFNKNGNSVAKIVGLHTYEELENIANSLLIDKTDMNEFLTLNIPRESTRESNDFKNQQIFVPESSRTSPRSHG